jgi:glycosyltransferase involved in cell wall biosynthesis
LTQIATQEIRPANRPAIRATYPHVGVVADFAEEDWRSMDLVADMIVTGVSRFGKGAFSAAQIRPEFTPRASRLPFVGRRKSVVNLDRLINRFCDYAAHIRQRRSGFDLFHVIDHSYAQLVHELPAERTVVTCHDLELFRCLIGEDSRPAWFRVMASRVLRGMQKAAHVIAVSDCVRNDLIRNGLIEAPRVTCIPNAIHPDFSSQPRPTADDLCEAILRRAGYRGGPILLNVGTIVARKRIDLLLRIFAELKKENEPVWMVRIGTELDAPLAGMAAQLGISSSILQFSCVDRDLLAAMYRRAAFLVHTSQAEGFGLPLAEAFACGCPALVTSIPPFQEVAAEAGEYCELEDIAAWTSAASRLLAESKANSEEWRKRQNRCINRAAKFTLPAHILQTMVLYDRVLRRSGQETITHP